MGSDERIVAAARVSYGKGTKSQREDTALIQYLWENGHTSPFEQVVLTFHCKMPIFVARQWVRHRTARINEISGRYSILKEEFYVPSLDTLCAQSKSNKQGRGEVLPREIALQAQESIRSQQASAYASYRSLLDQGLAREIARLVLPLSLYTEWYWQIDLHNLFHFLELRLDPHAQWETQQYARAIADITQKVAPAAFAAFLLSLARGGLRYLRGEKNG
jgi:thymidylate synthase (FAD)